MNPNQKNIEQMKQLLGKKKQGEKHPFAQKRKGERTIGSGAKQGVKIGNGGGLFDK